MQVPACEFAAVRCPRLSTWSCQRPFPTRTAASPQNKLAIVKLCAVSRRDDAEFGCGDSGRQVDEGMAVLRRRIDEIRAAECGRWEPPGQREEHEWYDAADDADACCDILIGALQALLLSERPGVGVGLVAALALAVPASAFVLVSHLLLSNLPR